LPSFERELIRARTGEGRARAVANGVRLGRYVAFQMAEVPFREISSPTSYE
jgi:DNA invertase Pin-like site-specific DNA recombinase